MLPAEGFDELADLDDLGRVEPDRRLVQDQDLGVVDQGLGDADPLLVAPGDVLDEPAPDLVPAR